MKVSFLRFVQTINNLAGMDTDRGCVIAGGVALAVARALPLPTACTDAPGQYYTFNNLQQAKELIAEFNEQVVFDVKECLDETREFWMLRYNAAHPPALPVYDVSIGFYDNLLGVPKFVDKESHSFNNKFKAQIFAVQVAASSVIKQLQACNV
jgi:hypothetical protein